MIDALIFDGVRSPRARAKDTGALNQLTPQALLEQLYGGLVNRTGLDPSQVGEVMLGCVTQHGEQAANIARTSLLYAGWPEHIPGITVHRFCSSSIDAIALGALKINAGHHESVVAGGVEMMSRVPMLSDNARIFVDGGFAAQCKTLMMGSGADLIASLEDVSREEVDEVALNSQLRAAAARDGGFFANSIHPIQTPAGTASTDECIRDATTMEGLAAMAPAFADLGAKGVDDYQIAGHPHLDAIRHVHTAGNSPAMADAASLMLLGSPNFAYALGKSPRARIAGSITVAADPLQVLTGCVAATEALMDRMGLVADDVDLFEIHKAFAATSVVARRRLNPADDKLNVNGGVIALGHPMGATGAIMVMTLLDELERRDLRCGIVAAAGAAGSGSALLIERDV